MAAKQVKSTDPVTQYKRRGGLASPIKQSGNPTTHISVGNGNKFHAPPKDHVKNQPQDC